MSRHCGREKICGPCEGLPTSSAQSIVCTAVGEVNARSVSPEASINIDELNAELKFWADDKIGVTEAMTTTALRASIELAQTTRLPYTGLWTEPEVNE